MKVKIEDIVLIMSGACAITITIVFIIFSIDYLKKPVYNQYDVNHDGKVNSTDYVLVKNYIMSENN